MVEIWNEAPPYGDQGLIESTDNFSSLSLLFPWSYLIFVTLVAVRIREGNFNPAVAGDLKEDMPGWLQELCKSCWAEDPSQRPSMKEICAKIQEAMAEPSSPPQSPRGE